MSYNSVLGQQLICKITLAFFDDCKQHNAGYSQRGFWSRGKCFFLVVLAF